MKIVKNLSIPGSKGRPMLTDIFYDEDGKLKPAVIFAHGFKGFKDWGYFNLMAQYFAESGFVFVKFNFSHNGTTIGQPEEFVDLEAFGNNNFSFEMDDLGHIIDFVIQAKTLKGAFNGDIFLLGHSRGGGIVILKAYEDDRIRKVATWASVNEYGKYWTEAEMEEWKQEGVKYILNSRTKQLMPMYFQMYEDYYEHKERLHIPTAVRNIKKPVLIVHGTDDTSVPYEKALELKQWNEAVELYTVEHGDHVFGGKYPWAEKELPDQAKTVIEKTMDFFKP